MASFFDDEAEVGTTDDEDEMETEGTLKVRKFSSVKKIWSKIQISTSVFIVFLDEALTDFLEGKEAWRPTPFFAFSQWDFAMATFLAIAEFFWKLQRKI